MYKKKRQKKRKWDKSKIIDIMLNIVLTILIASTYGLIFAYGIWKYCCRQEGDELNGRNEERITKIMQDDKRKKSDTKQNIQRQL